MRYRALLSATLILAAGCRDWTGPTFEPGPPALLIRDGAHAGNPDFFFLSPMVSNPSGSPNYGDNEFNPNLLATISICQLNATTEAGVTETTTCTGLSTVIDNVAANGNHYHANWKVPNSAAIFYRIAVSVGSQQLGFADVETGKNSAALKNVNTGEFVPLVDGKTLPIKFRIEAFALCDTPGSGPCASEVVNLAAGGEVTLEDGSGITIPEQPGEPPVVVTVETCPDLPLDLPKFGSCIRVTTDPPVAVFENPVSVFVCDLAPDVEAYGASEEQEHRITMHRFDAPDEITALPHVPGCEVETAAGPSFKKFFASLAKGHVKSAAREMVGLLGPKPLYAKMRIDQGGGGSSEGLSDFQFFLPGNLEIAAGDGQSAPPGLLPVNPRVRVVDVGGDPVKGATVTFTPSIGGSSVPVSVATDIDGYAETAWTIVAGANSLTAGGRGIAGTNENGPRGGDGVVDPFQPIQFPFDVVPVGYEPVPEPVDDGSVAFTAAGFTAPPLGAGFDFGSGGFTILNLGDGGAGLAGSDNTPPAGWLTLGFGTGGWSSGAVSPFGSDGGCPINAGTAGWPVQTDMLARKLFSTAAVGTLAISVRIDNDMQIFLDGVNISSVGLPNGGNSIRVLHGAGADDDWWQHDSCADINAPTFTVVNVPAGDHVLAIFAHDRGGEALLDVKVVFTPNP